MNKDENFTTFFICVILLVIIFIYFNNKFKDVEYNVSSIDGRKYLVQTMMTNKKPPICCNYP